MQCDNSLLMWQSTLLMVLVKHKVLVSSSYEGFFNIFFYTLLKPAYDIFIGFVTHL